MRLIDGDKLMEIITDNAYFLADNINGVGLGMFVDGIRQAVDEAAACTCGICFYANRPNQTNEWVYCSKYGLVMDSEHFCSKYRAGHKAAEDVL